MPCPSPKIVQIDTSVDRIKIPKWFYSWKLKPLWLKVQPRQMLGGRYGCSWVFEYWENKQISITNAFRLWWWWNFGWSWANKFLSTSERIWRCTHSCMVLQGLFIHWEGVCLFKCASKALVIGDIVENPSAFKKSSWNPNAHMVGPGQIRVGWGWSRPGVRVYLFLGHWRAWAQSNADHAAHNCSEYQPEWTYVWEFWVFYFFILGVWVVILGVFGVFILGPLVWAQSNADHAARFFWATYFPQFFS